QSFRPSRADQPSDSENFSFAQSESNRTRLGLTRKVSDFQHRYSERMRIARINILDFASHHQTDDVCEFGRGHVARANALAVAQHRVAVADALALFEKVADVNNADAALAQLGDDAKKIFHIDLREAARRFIHDED